MGTPILCTTLSKVGKSNIAYSLLLQTENPSWLYSVRQGATTVWERWDSYTYDRGFGNVDMNSFNHYSFGVIMEWMYRYMVGIQSLGTAFERVLFTPRPDMRADSELGAGQNRITFAKGSYKSKNGIITSQWRNDGNKFIFDFETPVSGEFHLQLIDGKNSVTVNGICTDIDSLEQIGGCAVIKLERGKHKIEY